MPTSVISNVTTDINGNIVPSVTVVITLQPPGGFRISDGSEVAPQYSTTSNGVGAWSIALEQTANISPTGSYYVAQEQYPASAGGYREYAFTVGAINATLFASLLAGNPPSPTTNYLTQTQGDARYAPLGTTPTSSIINVADHGILPNGSDISATFQTLLTNNAGASFVVPTGTYTLSGATVSIPQGSQIRWEEVTITHTFNGAAINIHSNVNMMGRLVINGDGVSASQVGLSYDTNGCTATSVEFVRVADCVRYGIWFGSTPPKEIAHNRIGLADVTRCGDGIRFETLSGTTPWSNSNLIEVGRVTSCTGSGVFTNYGHGNTIGTVNLAANGTVGFDGTKYGYNLDIHNTIGFFAFGGWIEDGGTKKSNPKVSISAADNHVIASTSGTAFAATDVNAPIQVPGAGSGASTLKGTISAFNSSTDVTIDQVAVSNSSSVTGTWGLANIWLGDSPGADGVYVFAERNNTSVWDIHFNYSANRTVYLAATDVAWTAGRQIFSRVDIGPYGSAADNLGVNDRLRVAGGMEIFPFSAAAPYFQVIAPSCGVGYQIRDNINASAQTRFQVEPDSLTGAGAMDLSVRTNSTGGTYRLQQMLVGSTTTGPGGAGRAVYFSS